MDDVDRLFQCFRCGVSPPESAVKERRASNRLKQVKPIHDLAKTSSPLSAKSTNPENAHEDAQVNSSTIKENTVVKQKDFSPIIFYGSPHGVPPKKPTRLLRLLREIRIDLAKQNKPREKIWYTFPRQDHAMKFSKDHPHARIFCYQDHANGQRRFLVTSYEEFWQRYKSMNPKSRHHYEVIQEGLPCHLYFDLEFDKWCNAEKNGDEMVDILISVVFEILSDKYSIEAKQDWIIELDSSTEAKFSRHLIICLEKAAFKDNSHAGAFVAEVCSKINNARENNERYESLFVNKDSNSAGISCNLFVDTAVYTRNRCFRLHLSSKAGKKAILLPSGRFKCKNMSEEEVFMASLICRMDNDCEKLLICKMDLECVRALHFDTEVTYDVQKHSESSQQFTVSAYTSDLSSTYLMGRSPFPALDLFVESVASTGNIPGKIYSWYWISEYGLMVYSMSRNRFCERIGREHKSNNVLYILGLRSGVYYQKCHDPDCQGYRSPFRIIPSDVVNGTRQLLNPEGSVNDNLEHQFAEDGGDHIMCHSDDNITNSCKKDGWWSEAIRFADNIEKIQNSQQYTEMDEGNDGDEEDWWKAAERTAAETEVNFFSQI
ncbi:DNA-directed primase/polymerase protein [Impatiens glandulifera]|uniref:DNA-directed primase/polymerase protein n=1 Tax=Impatiens glandulifera TaxID=253017 RepID=UPI001FB19FCB|nr:DNA-directed primase/polymerase protein [Impatiens glandulifera]